MEVAAWLHQQGLEPKSEWADRDSRAVNDAFPVRAAAAGGSAAALRWLVEKGYPVTVRLWRAGAVGHAT